MQAGDDRDRPRLARVCAAFGLGEMHMVRHLPGFWPLDRRYEHGDTSLDHFYVRNAATFGWWTENRAAVVAALTGPAG